MSYLAQALHDGFAYCTGEGKGARLRPCLNKVYRAEVSGCCSREFHVLRMRQGNGLLREYLAAILRSSLVVAQTKNMMTGNTRPRWTNDDVVNLVVPVPAMSTQQRIVQEAQRRREAARRLRQRAELGWAAAKQWFEAQLLEPAAQAEVRAQDIL